MEPTRKQIQFWLAMLFLCLIVAVAITLVDFGIKAAILEESNRLRKLIEGEEIGRVQKANTAGDSSNSIYDPPLPSSLLVDKPARMEAKDGPNGATKPGPNARQRVSKPRGQASPRTIQDGDK